MSRSKQNYDQLVGDDGNYKIKFDSLGRIATAIDPLVLAEGPGGPQGPEGPEGPVGPQGEKGDATSAYHAKDSVANVAALPTTGNEEGDVRLTENTQEFHVWGGTSWANAGSVVPVKGDTGPEGEKGGVGPLGSKGQQGETGDVGPQGPQGFLGNKGEPGEEGLKGEPGVNGQNADMTTIYTKGEADDRFLKKSGDVMSGMLDINTGGTSTALRVAGGFSIKAKGEALSGDEIFYSNREDNSVSYDGISTDDKHLVNKSYVDQAIANADPDLSGVLSQTNADNRYLQLSGGTATGPITVNLATGQPAFETNSSIFIGQALRLAENGTINHDNKEKIRITQSGVTIVDPSAENTTKTQGFSVEGNVTSGSFLLKTDHPQSGYDRINYYGLVDTATSLVTKSYVDTSINAIPQNIPITGTLSGSPISGDIALGAGVNINVEGNGAGINILSGYWGGLKYNNDLQFEWGGQGIKSAADINMKAGAIGANNDDSVAEDQYANTTGTWDTTFQGHGIHWLKAPNHKYDATTKEYVDNAVANIPSDGVSTAEMNTAISLSLSNYATLADLESAAPVGDEVLAPVLLPGVYFKAGSGSLTSTSQGPNVNELFGYYDGEANEWIGNWQAIKLHKDTFEGLPPGNTTENQENRIIEFYDRNSGNLLLKFVMKYVQSYGNYITIGRRYKMIANAGQATNQYVRGVAF